MGKGHDTEVKIYLEICFHSLSMSLFGIRGFIMHENLVDCQAIGHPTVEGDKGMPKGWLYHLGRHDRNGKAESRDTFGRKLACLSVCLSSLSLIDAQKTVAVPIRG